MTALFGHWCGHYSCSVIVRTSSRLSSSGLCAVFIDSRYSAVNKRRGSEPVYALMTSGQIRCMSMVAVVNDADRCLYIVTPQNALNRNGTGSFKKSEA